MIMPLNPYNFIISSNDFTIALNDNTTDIFHDTHNRQSRATAIVCDEYILTIRNNPHRYLVIFRN